MKKFFSSFIFCFFFGHLAAHSAIDAQHVLDMANLDEAQVNDLLLSYKQNEQELLSQLLQQINEKADDLIRDINDPREIFSFFLSVYSTMMGGAEEYLRDASAEVSVSVIDKINAQLNWNEIWEANKVKDRAAVLPLARLGTPYTYCSTKVDSILGISRKSACRQAENVQFESKWFANVEDAWLSPKRATNQHQPRWLLSTTYSADYCRHAHETGDFDGLLKICNKISTLETIHNILFMSQLPCMQDAVAKDNKEDVLLFADQIFYPRSSIMMARVIGGPAQKHALENIQKLSSAAAISAINKLELKTTKEIGEVSYKLVNLYALASFTMSDFMSAFNEVYDHISLVMKGDHFNLTPIQIDQILAKKNKGSDESLKEKLMKSFEDINI